jgi:hypothetical protein
MLFWLLCRAAHGIPAYGLLLSNKEVEMENLWLALHWGSPIGIGIFLVCLGGMIYLLSKADETSKRTKAMAREKGLEKKKE